MLYIAMLKSSVEVLMKRNVADVPRGMSTTLLSDDNNTFDCSGMAARFSMVPVNIVIEQILREPWIKPLTYADQYQIRNFTLNDKKYVTFFKQDSNGNRAVIVLTTNKARVSQGIWFGYDGDAADFFEVTNKLRLLLSDYEVTLRHKLD